MPSARLWSVLGQGGAAISLLSATLAVVAVAPTRWGGLAVGLTMTLAGLLTILTGRRLSGSEATAWSLIGAGVIAFGVGRLLWSLLTPGSVDATGVDLTIAAFHILVAVGVSRLPHLKAPRFGRLRIGFDTAVGSLAVVALLSWSLPTLHLSLLVLLATTSMVVIFAALRQSIYVRDVRKAVVLSGVAVVSVGTLMSLASDEAPASIVIWLLASAILSLLPWALVKDQGRVRQILARPARLGLLVPYLPAVVVVGVVADKLVSGQVLSPLLGLGVVLGVAALLGRSWASVREYQRLVDVERDQLLASMSHELRTPLTAVAGFAEVLTASWDRLSPQEARDMSSIIYRQSKRLVDLITDMAALARSELDTVEVDPRPTDGKALIRRALMDVFEGDLSGWRLRAEVEPYVQVMGDPRRLRQMVSALVENAKTYGGGSVLIVVKKVGTMRIIEVHDDGPGVDQRHTSTMWQRFERGAHQLDAAIPGAGLGLARVHDLAIAHAGTAAYRISDRLGGACFSLELPYEDLLAPSYLALRERVAAPRRDFPAASTAG